MIPSININFDSFNTEINNIEFQLEKIEKSMKSTESMDVLKKKIKKLWKLIPDQKVDKLQEKYQCKIEILKGRLCSLNSKISRLMTPTLSGIELDDLQIYDLIEVNKYPEGNSYTFKEKDLSTYQQNIIRIMQYPAEQVTLSMMKGSRNRYPDILKKLGYGFDFKEKTMTLPDADLLNHNCKSIPSLETFKAYSSKGLSPDDEFVGQYLEGKTILSGEKEFIHDHTVHIIDEINYILEGDGTMHREIITNILNPVMRVVKKANEELSESDEKKSNISKDLKQLLTLSTIWLDVANPGLKPLKTFDKAGFLKYASRVYRGPHLTKDSFNKAYPETPLTKTRAEYLDLMIAIILFPEAMKGSDIKEEVFSQIKNALTDIEVKWNEDTQRLSFTISESTELNIEDHPIEVIQMLREAVGME